MTEEELNLKDELFKATLEEIGDLVEQIERSHQIDPYADPSKKGRTRSSELETQLSRKIQYIVEYIAQIEKPEVLELLLEHNVSSIRQAANTRHKELTDSPED